MDVQNEFENENEVMTLAEAMDALRKIKDHKLAMDLELDKLAQEMEHYQALLSEKAADELRYIHETEQEMKQVKDNVVAQIDELEAQVKEFVLARGESVIVNDPNYPGIQAVYSDGTTSWDGELLWAMLIRNPDLWQAVKISWDTKILKTLAINEPEILSCQSKGKPYVSIKGV